jgi:hypothetical protein
MKTDVVTLNHNEKKETKIQIAQVIKLGSAAELTLGGGNRGTENTHQHFLLLS